MNLLEQSILNCFMSKKYGYPGIEDGKCAGLRTLDGQGEPCEECKKCLLQYQYEDEDSKKLKDMKEYLQHREGWDLKELIQDMAENTNLLKCNSFNSDLSIALDECSIIWGTLDEQADFLCGLDDFIDKYTEIFIKNICNLIDSYENLNY